jgi:hypothetical protein
MEALMRIDRYTKTLLTLIALLLLVLAVKPILQPTPASAQSPASGVQFVAGPGTLMTIDTKTGDIWVYVTGDYQDTRLLHWGKFAGIGKPLSK